MIDEGLKQFAVTDRQIEIIDALIEHGTYRKAASALNIAKGTVQNAIDSVKKKAAKQGYSPQHDMTHVAPDPFIVRGVSTYYNKDGKPSGQWVKTRLDEQKHLEIIKDTIQSFLEDIPNLEVQKQPLNYQTDIIPWIQIGDGHLGLLSHKNEVGENFDLKIAEAELCKAISILIDELPNCERMVINDLGDMTHYENFTATTEASGHVLDYDSRFPRMIKVYSRVMRFIVEKALTKSKFVDVIINQGNHSRTNDIWMAELLRVAYGYTDRVNILNNDSIFIAYRMGKTLVMTHHSDKCKPQRLADVMVTDFRKDYGETEFHYIDIGHVHHASVMKEYPSIIIESFNHLASLDRYAHDNGWRNRKSITVILRSKTYGEVGRRLLPIQEIRDKLNNALNSAEFEKEVFRV
jgi:hypothetical protein